MPITEIIQPEEGDEPDELLLTDTVAGDEGNDTLEGQHEPIDDARIGIRRPQIDGPATRVDQQPLAEVRCRPQPWLQPDGRRQHRR